MPVPEQHLGAVDVADAGEHGLVHQQRADRRSGCARSAARRAAGSAPRRSGSGPSRARTARPPAAVSTSQAVGAAQVGVRRRRPPAARRSGPRGGGRRAPAPKVRTAVEAEVDVQPAVAAEPEEQVLAVGVGLLEHPAVEQRGAGGEPALRAAHVHRRAGEPSVVLAGLTADGVTLGHRATLSEPATRPRGQPSAAPTSGRRARPRPRGSLRARALGLGEVAQQGQRHVLLQHASSRSSSSVRTTVRRSGHGLHHRLTPCRSMHPECRRSDSGALPPSHGHFGLHITYRRTRSHCLEALVGKGPVKDERPDPGEGRGARARSR